MKKKLLEWLAVLLGVPSAIPPELDEIADETIQLLCEKLAEQQEEYDKQLVLAHGQRDYALKLTAEAQDELKLNATMLARQTDLARQAENERDLARGAMRAQDENHRRQLEALGLAERFPSLTHLADDMGEALLLAERDGRAEATP